MEYVELVTASGLVVHTPVSTRRADAVRAKLAELDLTAQDARDAVTWVREAMAAASRKDENRAPGGMAAPRARSTPPRVVVDTDLVLSALVSSGGGPATLRRGWQCRRFTPLASKAMVDELMGGLARPKFRLTADEREDLLFDYLFFCEIVEAGASAPSAPARCGPSGFPSLELAITGRAKCLVTDDRDLASLATELPCPLVGADDFLAQLVPD